MVIPSAEFISSKSSLHLSEDTCMFPSLLNAAMDVEFLTYSRVWGPVRPHLSLQAAAALHGGTAAVCQSSAGDLSFLLL